MKTKGIVFLILLTTIFSCAPKVCPKPEQVLGRTFVEPKDGIYYGYIKVEFLRIPILIQKRGGSEEIKVSYRGLRVSTDMLCYEGMCFDLPVKPSDLIYGYFPGKYKVEHCNGELILKSRDGKTLYFSKGKLRKMKYKDITILYGKRNAAGFYEDILIQINDLKAKLIIEGREV